MGKARRNKKKPILKRLKKSMKQNNETPLPQLQQNTQDTATPTNSQQINEEDRDTQLLDPSECVTAPDFVLEQTKSDEEVDEEAETPVIQYDQSPPIPVGQNGKTQDAPSSDSDLNEDDDLSPNYKQLHHDDEDLVKHKDESYFCVLCPAIFDRESHLRRHQLVHFTDTPFECPVVDCKKSFRQSAHLERHLATHTRPKFVCKVPNCSKAYTTQNALNFHTNTTHATSKPYKCSICVAEFPMKGLLNDHTKNQHGDEWYQCSVCLREFKTKTNRNRHLRNIHGMLQNDYPRSSSKYVRHRKGFITLDEKIHQCPICSEECFETVRGLAEHLATHDRRP